MQIDEIVVQMEKEFERKQTKGFIWERVLRRGIHSTVSNSLKKQQVNRYLYRKPLKLRPNNFSLYNFK